MRWIVKGAIFSFAFIIVNKLLWYIFRVVLANYLGPEAYGTFSFAFAILSVLATFATFGFPLAMERYLAYHKDEKIKRKIIFFALNFVALLSSVLLLLVIFSGLFEPTVLLFLIALPFAGVFNVIAGVFRAHGKIEYQITCALIYAVINVLFSLGAMLFHLSLFFIGVGFVISYAITLTISLAFFRKILKVKAKVIEPNLIRKLLSFSWPLVTAGILAFIVMWTDTLMLGFLEPREVVGYYNAAVPIAKLALIFAFSLNSLLLPEISRRLADKKQVRRPIEVVYKWNLLLTTAFVLPMVIFPEFVIDTIFSPKYTVASVPLILLSIGMAFNALSQTTSRLLSLFEATNRIMITNLIAAVMNLILNFYLIPLYSMTGAAVASVASLFAQFVLLVYFAKQKMSFSIPLSSILPLLGFAAITIVFSNYIGLHAILVYAILAAIYIFMISKEERDYLLALIRNVSKLR